MIDFMLNDKGDIVINKGRIELIHNNELKAQKIRQVLKTNIGEWEYDEEEGINIWALLTKNPNYDEIQDNIESGMWQIDESLEILDINYKLDENRNLKINFTADSNSEIISVEI